MTSELIGHIFSLYPLQAPGCNNDGVIVVDTLRHNPIHLNSGTKVAVRLESA